MPVCDRCQNDIIHRPAAAAVKYEDYEYVPLPTNKSSIRVLILRGSGNPDAEIECELETIDFIKDKKLDYKYEALSWCWGNAKPTGRIIIVKEGKRKSRVSKAVTPDLEAALKALRRSDKMRCLWIDQICINQDKPVEKNHQVEMMSEIYARASKVCIWLGDGDARSRQALKFIKEEVLLLHNFDELTDSPQAAEKWSALLELMQRPWFSRRWVVQEIALAHDAVIYCGTEKLSWKAFAVAVELFVEVETATHRLSEVIKKDKRYDHVPGWFDHVSALGASLLVDATGKLFRDYKPNGPSRGADDDDDSEDPSATVSDSDDDDDEDSGGEEGEGDDDGGVNGVTRRLRANRNSLARPLLSLEYLVSSLSIFEMRTPHDAIYALLAIARDTTPFAADESDYRRWLRDTAAVLEGYTSRKRYRVNYQLPFADVAHEFVSFCIQQSSDSSRQSSDPSRALDIICRPWAPKVIDTEVTDGGKKKPKKKANKPRQARNGNATPSAPSSPPLRQTTFPYFGSHVEGNASPFQNGVNMSPSNGDAAINGTPEEEEKWDNAVEKNMPLPSWIQTLDGAPFAMYAHSGVDMLKLGRKNADFLVGQPASSHTQMRHYNAADTKKVDEKALRFVKRPKQQHWAMYARGFKLDEVIDYQSASQNGAIPESWAKAGGWKDVHKTDPPDMFWRTLVADRGRDGKNPPVYYSRACKESFIKGGFAGGSVSTEDLIKHERCSVIAQFCRRVQSVIWNRRLITTSEGTLGLAGQNVQKGDLICILYGCSVPVVLRCVKKTSEDIKAEAADMLRVYNHRVLRKLENKRSYRKQRNRTRNLDRALLVVWHKELEKEWNADPEGLALWRGILERWQLRQQQDHEQAGTRPKFIEVQIEGEENPTWFATNEGLDLSQDTQDRLSKYEHLDNVKDGADELTRQEALLKRRTIDKWKALKRKQWYDERKARELNPLRASLPDILQFERQGRMIQREERHTFTISLRYFRRWQRWLKRRKKERARETPADNEDGDFFDAPNSPERKKTADEEAEGRKKGFAEYTRRNIDLYISQYDQGTDEEDFKATNWNTGNDTVRAALDKWHYYTFLGECYVHGMMDGEAIHVQNEQEIPSRVFEMR